MAQQMPQNAINHAGGLGRLEGALHDRSEASRLVEADLIHAGSDFDLAEVQVDAATPATLRVFAGGGVVVCRAHSTADRSVAFVSQDAIAVPSSCVERLDGVGGATLYERRCRLAQWVRPSDPVAASALERALAPAHMQAVEDGRFPLLSARDISAYGYDLDALLYVAARRGHRAAAEHYLAHGADARRMTPGPSGNCAAWWGVGNGWMGWVRKHPEWVHLRNGTLGETPLSGMVAVANQGAAEIAALVALGADVNAREKGGRTPLHYARTRAVGQVLIDAGADLHVADDFGMTPLHRAARDGEHEVCQLLIDAGAHVDARDHREATPLLMAAYGGHAAVVRLLIEAGANIEAVEDYQGGTPLFHAARRGHYECVQALVAAAANHHATDRYGYTPLDRARENGGSVLEFLESLHTQDHLCRAFNTLEQPPPAARARM